MGTYVTCYILLSIYKIIYTHDSGFKTNHRASGSTPTRLSSDANFNPDYHILMTYIPVHVLHYVIYFKTEDDHL